MATVTKRPQGRTAMAPAMRIALGLIVAVLVVMLALSAAGGSGGEQAAAPGEFLPEGFPVAPGAQLVTPDGGPPGSVITMSVPGTADETVAFYGERLPQAGWTTEPWEGVDPFGDLAKGFIITKGDASGALSVTPGENERATVQVNMNQPTQSTGPPGSTGAG